MLEFYHVKHSKARKEHVCDLCGSKILPRIVPNIV